MDSRSRTVVFVTGAFVTHHCWDNWRAYFESHGYTTHAPPHPHKDGSPAVLRNQHPHSPIAENRIGDVMDMYADLIATLPEKPILIGHSFGGLLTQLLLQRGLGAAGVAIDSVPPQGVLSFKWSFIKSVLPSLGFFTSLDKTYLMSFKHWQYTFTNGMSRTEQLAAYEQFVVPESKRMARGGLSHAARVDFSRPHEPLLFLAGSDDHIIPASLNHKNYNRYRRHPGSVTAFKELPGRNHFLLGQPNWEETAGYALGWIEGLRSFEFVRESRPSFRLQHA